MRRFAQIATKYRACGLLLKDHVHLGAAVVIPDDSVDMFGPLCDNLVESVLVCLVITCY